MPALMQFLIASSRNHNNTPVPKTKPLPDEGEDSHIDGDSQAARHASIKPHLQLPSQASQAMTDEEKCEVQVYPQSESHGYDKKEEQYLDSFHTKIITLTSGKQLDSHVALQLLCASAILRQDVVAEDGPEGDHEQSILPTVPPADVSASPDPLSAPVDSKEDKQVIKNAMSSVDLDDIATDDKDNEANQQLHGAIRADGNAKHDLSSESTAKDEDSDWEADERHLLKLEQLSREILAGNYDLDHHAATPPLEFPSSLEDDGDEAVDVFDLTEISHTKTKKKPTCHLAKFTGTSPVGLDNEENPCNAEQSSQSFKHDEVGIMTAQRNIPWKALLNLLYMHQYTIVNWPAAVPAVGLDFNIKGFSADELHALTVPFLKEQMGADFHSEVHVEDEGDDSLVPVPMASFDLREWTPERAI
ncbi:hypothetical protein M404DRAFT_23345 [Pisolithus tinctorius Marx 270]|uniref:Uncharacterized protein n=1 Tax=Pisolithus tinctorius Marx 270 TaxID=870435 RepID=A0A0C3P4S8_PISTI|nr:hypothetical protein M404DRAFT_23345 [Pisolithus tinctorius Marx 270]